MQSDAMPARRRIKLMVFGRGEDISPQKLDALIQRLPQAVGGDQAPIVTEASLFRLEPFHADDWDAMGVRAPATDGGDELSSLLSVRFLVIKGSTVSDEWLDPGSWPLQLQVDEHVFMHGDAESRPGVWRIGLLSQAPHLDRAAFSAHWRDHHAPVVLDEDPLFDRYVSNVAIGDAAWDAVVEQRFDSVATLRRHDALIRTDRPAIAADIPRFLGRSRMFLASLAAHRGPGRNRRACSDLI